MLSTRTGWETLKPYSVDHVEWNIRLDANERATNLPPVVLEAVTRQLAAIEFNRYPDMAAARLRTSIAQNFGLTVSNILVGNGSSELLAAICQTFGGAGRSVVFSSPSFSMYPVYAKLADCTPKPVSLEADFSFSCARFLKAIQLEQPNLVILCNPNNPTGGVMPFQAIEQIVSQAACPVVVDEAYYEFYGQSAVNLLAKYPNLIIVRTFSKAYGLAAARVGYLLAGEKMAAAVAKALLPYHLNSLSLVTAETVYRYRQEFQPYIEQTIRERERVAKCLRGLAGIAAYPSKTNFILVKAAESQELIARLAAKSIGVRDFHASPELAGCFRISIGTPAENDAMLEAVLEYQPENANQACFQK